MKKYILILSLISAVLFGRNVASAQYYEIANQLPGLISPALSGSFKYKGFVEMSGVAGVGDDRANFLGISTSQGFQYASWFYMGVGLGVDVAMGQENDPLINSYSGISRYNTSKTKVMVPVFTDFRFSVPSTSSVSFFADIKIGAAWLLGDSYLRLNTRYMDNSTQFYFKPTLGLRFGVNKQKPNQAINIGVSYMLLTANNSYSWYSYNYDTPTLSNVGVSIAYEW